MSDASLPPDLAELERELCGRAPIEPSADFADRVLGSVRRALRHPPMVAAAPSWGWRSWAAVAAAVFVAINLSMSAAADTDWHLTADIEPSGAAALADELRVLAPDLPESELRRQAWLARAGAGLPRVLNLSSVRERTSVHPERDPWDVR
jgi:hypothetical protein